MATVQKNCERAPLLLLTTFKYGLYCKMEKIKPPSGVVPKTFLLEWFRKPVPRYTYKLVTGIGDNERTARDSTSADQERSPGNQSTPARMSADGDDHSNDTANQQELHAGDAGVQAAHHDLNAEAVHSRGVSSEEAGDDRAARRRYMESYMVTEQGTQEATDPPT
ncbi:unnamed protein product [Heligmosomoides polygyrus]|uniref:Uncharacterized protein n=1 Tax=Heligmosomoides polygyrus TaxID=6339 RepID=A0A3P8A7R6_HELPZ|nr:unnamed protein product [Heligmosomoides polygyrus]